MTVIAGLVYDGEVYIGGDGAANGGSGISSMVEPKVWKHGDFVFGFCDSFRMGEILKYRFKPPVIPKGKSLDVYMRTLFVDWVIGAFKDNEFLWQSNGTIGGGVFLIGTQGRLFQMDDDFHIGENTCGYDAIGSGYTAALGSLYSTVGDPRYRVMTAMKAAEEHVLGIRGPYTIVSTGEDDGTQTI